MEILETVRAVRRRWLIVVSVFLVAVAAAAGASLVTTPVYAATTRLLVSATSAGEPGTNYTNDLYAQQRVASYAQLVQGAEVAQRVVDELGVPLTATALAAKVSVEVVPETVLLDVTVRDTDPATARDLADAVAAQLSSRVQEIETPPGASSPTATATVVEPALLPTTAVEPAPVRNLALGVLVGLVLGLAGAVLRDRLDNTVRDRGQVEAGAGAAMIGAVPFDPDRPAHPLISFGDGHSGSAEAYRQIRTNLQFLDVDRAPRVLVVTSAVPGEGKTVTAINLALVLAEAGSTVALVEGDLRRPRVVRYAGLVDGVGVTNVLASTADVVDVLQQLPGSTVDVLAAGPHPPNPSELLGSENMRTLLEQLRSDHDYVIIDAPPLLPVTDAAVLTAAVDGAILVTRHGHTKREQLSRAAGSLRAIDARILGVILNMAPGGSGSAYEYAYYYEADTDRATVVPEARSGAHAAPPRRPSPSPVPALPTGPAASEPR